MGLIFRTEAKFHSIVSCKNPQYSMLHWIVPEIYKGVPLTPTTFNVSSLIPSEENRIYQGLKPGDNCLVELDVSIEQARDKYPAKIKAQVIKFEQKSTSNLPPQPLRQAQPA